MSWERQYPKVGITAYDPAWPTRYTEIASILGRALGESWVLEHVGSTSVPGLAAKPVIDIAVGCPPGIVNASDIPIGPVGGPFAAAGWTAPQPLGDHWAAFLLANGIRCAIAHVFTSQQWPDAHVRLFSDWLREHPEDKQRYQDLKASLVAGGVWGSEYTQAKTTFVRSIVNQARAARGLNPVTTL